MNTFKKTGGFTLVELIIVIAILAILSSVAVAGYSAYIGKANEASVNAWKNDIQTAATLANAEKGAVAVEFSRVEGDDTKVLVIITGPFAGDFESLFETSINNTAGDINDAEVVGTVPNGVEENEYFITLPAPKGW